MAQFATHKVMKHLLAFVVILGLMPGMRARLEAGCVHPIVESLPRLADREVRSHRAVLNEYLSADEAAARRLVALARVAENRRLRPEEAEEYSRLTAELLSEDFPGEADGPALRALRQLVAGE